MVYIDQTDAFRSLIASGSRPSSPPPAARKPTPAQVLDDSFLKEAYQIHGHLADLSSTLVGIRKLYLSTAEPPPTSRRARGKGAQGEAQEGDEMRRYEGTTYLTERERDEIDVRAKLILRRCKERVAQLEAGEKARQEAARPAASALFNLLAALSQTGDDGSAADRVLSAHRSSVMWTLSSELARLTKTQADMQEERARRRAERSRTLGGGAAREARELTGGGSSKSKGSAVAPAPMAIVAEDEAPIEEQLSAAQLQQFESENNALLEHMESQLDSVLKAERGLVEISNLQTELVRHLAMQTKITDRLYDEAIGSVAQMGDANKQLKQAKERSGEARLFLLVFLFGASFALLFLDWYAR